jgi:hypothetical protein
VRCCKSSANQTHLTRDVRPEALSGIGGMRSNIAVSDGQRTF